MSSGAHPPIILASGSTYRRELLARIVPEFACESPDIDETPKSSEPPIDLASRLATEKARKVATNNPGTLVIGSDQVASLYGEILGKPGSHEAAATQLEQCAGHRVHFYTGLCLIDTRTGEEETVIEDYTAHFRDLSQEEIQAYLKLDEPYDCAGSFKVERHGVLLFEQLEGSDPNALVGLPLIRLARMLRRRGFNPLLAGRGN